jgi:predicted phosphodiesterase
VGGAHTRSFRGVGRSRRLGLRADAFRPSGRVHGHGPYDFLAWNAFLAWIPYALAAVVVAGHRRGIHPYLLVLGGLVWLLFLPNALYIVTDFVHLGRIRGMPSALDAATIGSFACTGLLFGFDSLRRVQSLARNLGALAAWLLTLGALALLRAVDVALPRLPEELAGVRIAHLSDFHLGLLSRRSRAVEQAVEWVRERRPELVVVTGDLVSRPRGEPVLHGLLARLGSAYVVLGNHDVEHSRDPFSRAAGLTDLAPAHLLVDEAATVDLRGKRVQFVGVRVLLRREPGRIRHILEGRLVDVPMTLSSRTHGHVQHADEVSVDDERLGSRLSLRVVELPSRC